MPNPPIVSVILTSYNHEKYIRESIESALNQTFKDFELIIWDDASTDASWDIITSYTDKRIRAFRNETNQFWAYFPRVISDIARGAYVAIHHSDDIWEPEKLEKQVALLDAHPQVGAVFTNALIIGEEGEPFDDEAHNYYNIFDQPNRTRYEWLNHFFYHGNALCHPSVLIRKGCLEDCGTYRYGIVQANDLDLWVRFCLKYEIHVLPKKLVRFRVRANEMNVSSNRPEAHIRGVFELYQILNHYRHITVTDEFTKIFPNTKEYFKQNDYDIGFALGMASLEPETSNFKKLFGLQLLFEAINDPVRAKKIDALYKFGHLDLIALTAKYDVFSTRLVQDLSARFIDKERENQALLSQLHLQNSTAWSLMLRLRQLRRWIAPPGGRREKLLNAALQGLRIWKNKLF